MSTYTYVNIFTEFSQSVRSNISLRGYTNIYSRGSLDLVFVRMGGDARETVETKLLGDMNGSLVYCAPVDARLEDGDSVGYVLIDKMEDTGNSHRTKLYSVSAFQDSKLIDNHDNLDDDIVASQTQEHYDDEHDLDVKLDF